MIYLQTVVKFALSYWKKVHRDFYIVYFKNYTFHYFFFSSCKNFTTIFQCDRLVEWETRGFLSAP